MVGQIGSKMNHFQREASRLRHTLNHDFRAFTRGVSGLTTILKEDYGYLLDETGQQVLHEMLTMSQRYDQRLEALTAYLQLIMIDQQYEQFNVTAWLEENQSNLLTKYDRVPELVIQNLLPQVYGMPTLLEELFIRPLVKVNDVSFVVYVVGFYGTEI